MTEQRKGEEGPVPFRSGRMFNVGGQWYFASREGDQGPFESREAAEAELSFFLRARATEFERLDGGD